MLKVLPNFDQGRESARKKKRPSSKKQRRYSGDELPQDAVDGHRDVSLGRHAADDRTSPVSARRNDRLDSQRKDRQSVDDDLRLLGSLPPLTPTKSSRSDDCSDQPTERYRRLTEDEDGSRLTDRHGLDTPNDTDFPGPVGNGGGKVAAVGLPESLNTGE